MKVIWIYLSDNEYDSGVHKKIISMTKNLYDLNVNIKLFFIHTQNDYYFKDNYILNYYLPSNLKRGINFIKKIIYIRKIILNTIKNSDSDTIIYFRYMGPLIFYYPFNYFSRNRPCNIITEHQSIEINEYKLNKCYLIYFFEFFFRKLIRSHSNGIIGVTNEITEYQANLSYNNSTKLKTLGNGIDLKLILVRHPPNYIITLSLLCVANVSKWHGLDRFLHGLSEYNGAIKVFFHIVGEGTELSYLHKLSNDLNINQHVIIHGFKTGDELNGLFNQCHIAIGSLGIHRIGLSEASILKSREYCARGIPYIIACSDPDFPDDFPYILRVPADESPIDIEKVIEFTQRIYKDPGHPQKMRAYAEEHLDWSVKMRKLKGFLETLVEE